MSALDGGVIGDFFYDGSNSNSNELKDIISIERDCKLLRANLKRIENAAIRLKISVKNICGLLGVNAE